MVPSHTRGATDRTRARTPPGTDTTDDDDQRPSTGPPGRIRPGRWPATEPREGPGEDHDHGQADEADHRQLGTGRRAPGRRVHARLAASALDQREHAGQYGADQDRLGVGVGAEVDPGGVGTGSEEDGHLDDRGDRAHRGHHQHGPHPAPEGPGEVEHGQHHQRPHQVELLLDGQRPGVGERRGGPGGHEVVAAGRDLPPVGEVEQGGERTPPVSGDGPVGSTKRTTRVTTTSTTSRAGQQPPGPAQPEGGQADPVPPLELGRAGAR